MKYLKISNHTEIEENAFKLIGACTKQDDDSKIGYFGSGLKYALAVLLRENIGFRIFSGTKEIKISVKAEMFREQAFNVISICGEKTSLTTSMGVDWKPWQAIREVFCNALDESTPSHSIVSDIEPVVGVTSFYIEANHDEIQYIIKRWSRYFAQDRKVLAGECCRIYDSMSETVNIYRKGIRCLDSRRKSLYDYDFDNIDITESRTARYSFQIDEGIAKLWGKFATPAMINRLIKMGRSGQGGEYYESQTNWNVARFSDVWVKHFEGKALIPSQYAGWFPKIVKKENSVVIDDKLLRALIKQFGDSITTAVEAMDAYGKFCITKPDKKQQFLLKECMTFLEEVKLTIPYDIKIGVFQEKDVLGTAKENTIILAAKLFDRGKKQIVNTIIEECAHLDSQCTDESRGFQDYLINQIVTLLENQHGVFL